MSEERHKIYLALPTYEGLMQKQTARLAFVQPGGLFDLFIGSLGHTSLCCSGYNGDWANALRCAEAGDCTHFAMLHADIMPDENWLVTLIEEMEATGATVLAAVTAIKDNSGDSSTAIFSPEKPWEVERLGLRMIQNLPMDTFSIDDVGIPGQSLLINTGCMLVDLRGGWAHETDEEGCLKTFFTINDRVQRKDDGNGNFNYTVASQPEDWNFARMAAAAGARVMATRKVNTRHRGYIDFLSNPRDTSETDVKKTSVAFAGAER